MDGDLLEDNSSSTGASSSSRIRGSFPLLRANGCTIRLLSLASSWIFSIWACN